MLLIAEFAVFLTTNLVLMQALGTSTLFIAAGNKKNLFWISITIFVFTTLGSAAVYFINRLLSGEFSDFRLLFYTLSIGILYIILLSVLYFVDRKHFESTRKYVHVSAFNCAVMGTLFSVSDRFEDDLLFCSAGDFMAAGAEAGAGFIIASLVLTAAYRQLNSKDVPSSLRGFPAVLIYLGIISMAVYALI